MSGTMNNTQMLTLEEGTLKAQSEVGISPSAKKTRRIVIRKKTLAKSMVNGMNNTSDSHNMMGNSNEMSRMDTKQLGSTLAHSDATPNHSNTY